MPKQLQALFWVSALALQFGLQPILSMTFVGKEVNRAAAIVVQELLKILFCFGFMLLSGTAGVSLRGWTLSRSLRVAALPAAIYSLQNPLILAAMQSLPGVVFNVINQSKLVWTALLVRIALRKKQSYQQILAFVGMLAVQILSLIHI